MKKLLGFLLTWGFALGLHAQIQPNVLTIARGNEDYPPYEMHVDGKLTGLHIALVEAIAARLGSTVVWKELPWLRAQKCAEEGECDAITYLSQTAERDKWAIFLSGNVLSKLEMRFVVRKDDAATLRFNGNTDDFLKGKSLVAMAGYTYGPVLDKATKYEVKSLPTLIAMVAERRYNVAMVNIDDFAALKGKPYFDDVMLLNPPAWESNTFIAFSKAAHAEALASRFQAAYGELKKSRDYLPIVRRFKS